jgi:hypothetical protein
VEVIFEHKTNKGNFKISSTEIRNSTEGVSLQKMEIREAITDLIKNNITDIQ